MPQRPPIQPPQAGVMPMQGQGGMTGIDPVALLEQILPPVQVLKPSADSVRAMADAQVNPETGRIVTDQDVKDADAERDTKRASVKHWLCVINEDKKRWDDDFKRMEMDEEFAFGLQRPEQKGLHGDEYQCNLVERVINQKVANLYAKNPTAEFQRRKRRDFQVWDEKLESLAPVVETVGMGALPTFNQMALMMDYAHGMEQRQLIDNIGQTLQILYQYQMDEHDPDFKLQMKSLVRRVCTCGVGYVYLSFARDVESTLSSDGMDNTILDRAKKLKELLDRIEDSSDTNSPYIEEVKSLLQSMQATVSGGDVQFNVNERLVFDFLPSTAVIPDKNCRNLKGFIGARHITIERVLPLEEVNAFFETNIKVNDQVRAQPSRLNQSNQTDTRNDSNAQPLVSLYEVLDKQSKSHFFLVEGYDDFVQEPELLDPQVKGFWPVYTLAFNDTEHIAGTRSSIFPPSDVTLMMHSQKEWNRTRESLRKQRNANAAKYVTRSGWLTEDDKDKLEFAEENAVIELVGLDDKMSVDSALSPMVHDKIEIGDQRYDTSPLMMDILMAVGAQDANIGPPNPKGTATGQSIAEQSRNIGIVSNIDDLDDFLSALSDGGGQMLLQAASEQTVKTIVGIGGVWPAVENRVGFLNAIFLKVVAASSGRPNKVLELNNWQAIAPILQAAGANPAFMVRETIKRVDDRLDPNEAFPLMPAQPQAMGGGQEQTRQRPKGDGERKQVQDQTQQPPQQSRPGPGQIGSNQKPPARRQGPPPVSAQAQM